MVLSVMLRVLGNHHNAEDAFQRHSSSSFARHSPSHREHGRQLALWRRLSNGVEGQAMAVKRRVREKQVTEMPEPEIVQQNQDLWHDVQLLLDQELSIFLIVPGSDRPLRSGGQDTQGGGGANLAGPRGHAVRTPCKGKKNASAERLARRGGGCVRRDCWRGTDENAATASVSASLVGSTVRPQASLRGTRRLQDCLAKVAALAKGI